MSYKINERWISSGGEGNLRVYWEIEVRGSSVNDVISISTRYIGSDQDGIPARDSDSVSIMANDVSRMASIFTTLDEKINGSKATDFKERCEEIIGDELGRHASKFPGNCNIICALRLADFAIIKDFKKTMELAHFIESSWTDLELTEDQKKKIILKLVELRKRNDNDDFEEEVSSKKSPIEIVRQFMDKKIKENNKTLVEYSKLDQMAFVYGNAGDDISKLQGENRVLNELSNIVKYIS